MKIENHVLASDKVDTRFVDYPKRGGVATGPDAIIIHDTGASGAAYHRGRPP